MTLDNYIVTKSNAVVEYEILEMTLREFQSLVPVTVTFVDNTNAERKTYTVKISNSGCAHDVMESLQAQINVEELKLPIGANFSSTGGLRLIELLNKHKFLRVLRGYEPRKSTWLTTPLIMTTVPADEIIWSSHCGGVQRSVSLADNSLYIFENETSGTMTAHEPNGTQWQCTAPPPPLEWGHNMVTGPLECWLPATNLNFVIWIHHVEARDGPMTSLYGVPFSMRCSAADTVADVKSRCAACTGMTDRAVDFSKWTLVRFDTNTTTAVDLELGMHVIVIIMI